MFQAPHLECFGFKRFVSVFELNPSGSAGPPDLAVPWTTSHPAGLSQNKAGSRAERAALLLELPHLCLSGEGANQTRHLALHFCTLKAPFSYTHVKYAVNTANRHGSEHWAMKMTVICYLLPADKKINPQMNTEPTPCISSREANPVQQNMFFFC